MQHVSVIEVRIWDKSVGALARDPSLDAYVFEYAASWARRGIELAPFKMPVADHQGSFAFPDLEEGAFRHLPGLLADALPDDFGNQLINAWMARQGYRRLFDYDARQARLHGAPRHGSA